MDSGRRALVPHIIVAALLALFVAFSLRDLGRAPRIHEDEAPIVAPGLQLFTAGVFGSPLDGGFAGGDRHCYEFMPLFPIFAGAFVRVLGLSLFAARLAPLLVATAVLLLTHGVGTRYFSAALGAAATALLVLAPVAAPLPHLLSGIPIVDFARLVRYDAPVGLFGLAALLVLAPAIREEGAEPRRLRLFATGVFVGLATLCHVYGAFWLVALLAALAAARGWTAVRRALLPCAAGFLVALLPWLLFVASGWNDFVAQNLPYAGRVSVLDPRFYVQNLRGEIARYGRVIEAAKSHPAPWLFFSAAAFGAGVLIGRARRGTGTDRAAAAALLAVPAVLAVLFAALIQPKTPLYLAMLWPLYALVAARGLLAAWRSRRAVKIAVFAACLVVAADGARALRRFAVNARSTAPYAAFEKRLSALVPKDGRVMGMKMYWLGLGAEHSDYVTVPFHWTLPRYSAHPVTFTEALDILRPRVFLLDDTVRGVLERNADAGTPFHDQASALREWLRTRGHALGVVETPTYGRVEVYAILDGP